MIEFDGNTGIGKQMMDKVEVSETKMQLLFQQEA